MVGTFGWKTEDDTAVIATGGTVDGTMGGWSVGSSEDISGSVGCSCSCWGG